MCAAPLQWMSRKGDALPVVPIQLRGRSLEDVHATRARLVALD